MNNNNNTTDGSSADSVDDSTQPSPIRPFAVTVKIEPGVSVLAHNSPVDGIDSTAVTGSRNENPLVIPSSPSPPTSPQSPPRLSNHSIILPVSGGRDVPVDLITPTKAGKIHSRDDSKDTINDTDNNKKTNLDICIQKEASKEQALIVAAGAAASAAASAVTSSILPATLIR